MAGAYVYTPPAGTFLPVGNGHILSVTFTPTDIAHYSKVTASTTIEVTAQPALPATGVTVTRGGFRRDRKTGHFFQAVTLQNASAVVVPVPVSLVLDGLRHATLVNKTGTISCVRSAGVPGGGAYINLDVGADGLLTPGESATIVLEFDDPFDGGIRYGTRVLAGPGCR